MVDLIVSWLGNIPLGWRVFFLSMLPITELRGAIPLGVLWGLEPTVAYLWAVTGNFLPLIPLLLGLKALFRQIARHPRWQARLAWLEKRGLAREREVHRYGILGLMLLVAVPLPGTGVWTGALVAALLNLGFVPALLAITLGELIAGVLVCLIVTGALALSQVYLGEWVLAGAAVLALAVLLWRRSAKRKR